MLYIHALARMPKPARPATRRTTHCKRKNDKQTHPDQPVLGLELLGGLDGVIDQTEACGLATTELQAMNTSDAFLRWSCRR